MDKRSGTRTEPRRPNFKQFECLQDFSRAGQKSLEEIDEMFLRNELTHICHYIEIKKILLQQVPKLQDIIVLRIQSLWSSYKQHFQSIQNIFLPLLSIECKPNQFSTSFREQCSLLRLNRHQQKPFELFIDKKQKSITSSLTQVKLSYVKFTDETVGANIHLKSLESMSGNNFMVFNSSTEQSRQNDDSNLQKPTLNNTKQTNRVTSAKLQITQIQNPRIDSGIQIPGREENVVFCEVNNEENINSIHSLLLQTALRKSGCVFNIRQIGLFSNSFNYEYLIFFKEKPYLTLSQLLIHVENTGSYISERVLAALIVDLINCLKVLHEHCFAATSFSPEDIAFSDNKWKFLSIPFVQQLEDQTLSGGYFELMSPQLQQIVVLGNGKWNQISSDYYNLGSIIQGSASQNNKYSNELNQMVDFLTQFQSSNRTQDIDRFLPYFEKIADRNYGNFANNSYNINMNNRSITIAMNQALLALGSKSLALSALALQAGRAETDYKILFQKAFLLQKFEEFPDAITYFQKAEVAAHSAGKAYYSIPINNNIGNILLQNNKHKQSLPYFQKAVDCSINLKSKNSLEYARSLENLASAYLELGKSIESEKMFSEALQVKQKLFQDENEQELCITYNNIGISQEKQEKHSLAIGNFKRCIQILENNLEPDYSSLANLNEKVGNLFMKLGGRSDDSANYLNKAVKYLMMISRDEGRIQKINNQISNLKAQNANQQVLPPNNPQQNQIPKGKARKQ